MRLKLYSKGGALMAEMSMEGVTYTALTENVLEAKVTLTAMQYGIPAYVETHWEDPDGRPTARDPVLSPEQEFEAGEKMPFHHRVRMISPDVYYREYKFKKD